MTTRNLGWSSLEPGLTELARMIDRGVPPTETQFCRGPVWISRARAPIEPVAALYTPMFCVVAQGAKELLLADERYVYSPGGCLLNSVAVPAAGGVIEATEHRPCLWTMIELDPALVESVITDGGLARPVAGAPLRTVESCAIDGLTLDAVIRLVRLFDSPDDFDYLSPLLLKEIVYRLLQTDQAARLRQVAASGGRSGRVIRAVEWLRDHYDQPVAIETLAQECGLSVSALHHHFKDVTAMSPLQYQKQLRLQEAKRLMIGEGLDAASAGVRVGYDDPSYFSREYRRFFGAPPRRHVTRARSGVA